jgi:hypothetical protein
MAVPVGGMIHPEMVVAKLSQVRFRGRLVYIGFMLIGHQGRAWEEVLLHQGVEMVFPPIFNVIDYDQFSTPAEEPEQPSVHWVVNPSKAADIRGLSFVDFNHPVIPKS